MNRIVFLRLHRSALVHRISGYVKDPAHDTFADGHVYWPTCIYDLKASFETFGAGDRDRSNPLVSEMLLHLEC